MGVVYHSKYLHFFELGRTEAMRAAGMRYRDLEDEGVFLAVSEVGVRYLASARYDDLLTVRSRITAVGKARLRFDYEVAIEDGAPLVTGHTMLACVDENNRPRRLPPRVLELARSQLEV